MQLARRLLQFVKATVVGGVFVLAPIVLLVYVIGKAVTVAYDAFHPLGKWLPVESVGGVSLALLAAITALIAVCFFAGLVAKTAIAKWLVRTIESAVLHNLPGYTLMKSMGANLAGAESEERLPAVLVRFDDQSQVGFLMEELADGRAIVFIPSVPSPWSGSLHVIDPDRVTRLPAPIAEVIDRLRRLGVGLGPALTAIK
jgi:uncharacterized membrane protein